MTLLTTLNNLKFWSLLGLPRGLPVEAVFSFANPLMTLLTTLNVLLTTLEHFKFWSFLGITCPKPRFSVDPPNDLTDDPE